MPILVHLTTARHVRRIMLSGIKGTPGVACLPVLPRYAIAPAWLADLQAAGAGPLLGVYFCLDGAERVLVSRWFEPHQELSLAEALARVERAGPDAGYRLVVPHAIPRRAIAKVRVLTRVAGWEAPQATGPPRACTCAVCQSPAAGLAHGLQERLRRALPA